MDDRRQDRRVGWLVATGGRGARLAWGVAATLMQTVPYYTTLSGAAVAAIAVLKAGRLDIRPL